MLKGVDISKWNGRIDFSKLKEQVDFVIIRAGYGKLTSQKDERFEEYYAACEKYGISKGCYWTSYATSGSEAVQEANAFLSCVKGKKFEYPVMFDYEAFPGYEKQREPSVARAVITNFIDIVKNAGYYVGLYSYYLMLKNCIPRDMQDGRYDIWLAHYVSSTPYTGHKIWQYSSSGRFNGIPCKFDMNYCYVDNYPEIIQEGGYNGYAKNDEVVTPTPVVAKPTNVTYPIDSSTTKYEQKHYAYSDKTQLSKHFNVQEFRCKCGKQHDIVINTRLVAGLEKLFETFDCSMIIVNSGYRCPEYDIKMNRFAGKHAVGDAADVVFYDKNRAVISTKKISCAAQDMEGVFGGIANINKTYTAIHLDVRQGHRWLGNEVVSNNTVTKDFYSYYGLSKEDVYGKTTPTITPEPVAETPKVEPKIDTNVTPLVAGTKINLNNTNLYVSSTTSNVAKKLSGDYYMYDNHVVNGRIRITNSADKVGKGISNVIGWVDAASVTAAKTDTTSKPTPVVETKKEDTAIITGKEVKLNNTPLYASATASRYSSKKTGTYYVYSDEVVKGRVRITNKKENVGKGMSHVTGWVNVSDIK